MEPTDDNDDDDDVSYVMIFLNFNILSNDTNTIQLDSRGSNSL